VGEGEALAHGPKGHQGAAAGHHGGGEDAKGVGIGVEHRRRSARQQGIEKPQLGGAIGLHGLVIVEVILGEIEEGGGGEAHAVQAPLVNAVRGGFDGEVGDAEIGELRQALSDHSGVRRGETRRRQLYLPGRNPQRPHARRGPPHRGENLPAEGRHRGLAVGASDRDDDLGLPAVESGGGQGIGAARIVSLNDRRADIVDRLALSTAAAPPARASETKRRPSSVDPGKAAKRKPRLHTPAVGRHAGDHRVDSQVALDEIGEPRELHSSSPVSSLGSTGGGPPLSTGRTIRFTFRKGAIRFATRPAMGAEITPPVVKPPVSGVA